MTDDQAIALGTSFQKQLAESGATEAQVLCITKVLFNAVLVDAFDIKRGSAKYRDLFLRIQAVEDWAFGDQDESLPEVIQA
jgi:hypothetical protein